MQKKYSTANNFYVVLILFLVLFLTTVPCFSQGGTIRVSCVGNSITWGAGLSDRENNHYPAKLGDMLNTGWEVNNYAYWGRTATRTGDFPYWDIPEFTAAMESEPDIVTIMLGANDAKTLNWFNAGSEFKADYELMIDTFQKLETHPQIWICYTPPALENEFGIDNQIIKDSIMPILSQISYEMGLPVMDLYAHFLDKNQWYDNDGVHPNLDGSGAIALKFKEMLTMEQPVTEQNGNSLSTGESEMVHWYLNGSPIPEMHGGNEKILVIKDTGTYQALLSLSDESDDRILSVPVNVDTINEAISGEFIACAGTENVVYTTGSWPGKTINWIVSDGTITEGQGTSEITVNWNTEGFGEIMLMLTEGGSDDTIKHEAFVYLMENPKPEFELVDLNLEATEASSYEWFRDGVAVPEEEGGLDQVLEAHTGNYHLVATYENGCQSVSDTVTVTMEGIETRNTANQIILYPNPASQTIYINCLSTKSKITQMVFFDILGNQVKKIAVTRGNGNKIINIPVGDLVPGYYLVGLYSGIDQIAVKGILISY